MHKEAQPENNTSLGVARIKSRRLGEEHWEEEDTPRERRERGAKNEGFISDRALGGESFAKRVVMSR